MQPLIITQHSSSFVPFDILVDMIGTRAFDKTERDKHLATIANSGDLFTDLIYYVPGAAHVSALTSRFVVDLNRVRDKSGDNGVIKLTTFSGEALYPAGFDLDEKTKERRLEHYYDPFHARLDTILQHDDIGYFIDGHAMTHCGPDIGPDAGKLRPAFCVMNAGDANGKPTQKHLSLDTERTHHVAELLHKHFKDIIEASDVPDEILLNDPFPSGGTIDRLSDPERPGSKPGFGVEFNSNLYLDDSESKTVSVIPGRVTLLNQRFREFVQEVTGLFE